MLQAIGKYPLVILYMWNVYVVDIYLMYMNNLGMPLERLALPLTEQLHVLDRSLNMIGVVIQVGSLKLTQLTSWEWLQCPVISGVSIPVPVLVIPPSPTAPPGEPSNPTLTQVNITTFKVLWGAPTTGSTVTGYRVFYTIDGDMRDVMLEANELEWAHVLNENQIYAISLNVQSLSEFFSSLKVNIVIPQGNTL